MVWWNKSSRPASSPSVAGPAVVCRRVTKDYLSGDSRVRALQGIDLEVSFGEKLLLVGQSGCGKTTLISILAGLLDPTEGDVELLGHSREQLRGRRLVQFRGQHVGFVFQQYNLLPALTAAENVAVPLLIQGLRRAEALPRAEAVLRSVGLGDRVRSTPAHLSGGQQQRVAIARALVHNPQLLVCDEPTSALDAKSGRNVMELLRTVAVQPDRAVIVVTHDNRVFEFGDRIVSLSDGQIESVEVQSRTTPGGAAGGGVPAS